MSYFLHQYMNVRLFINIAHLLYSLYMSTAVKFIVKYYL